MEGNPMQVPADCHPTARVFDEKGKKIFIVPISV